eukprot:s291_g27.t1
MWAEELTRPYGTGAADRRPSVEASRFLLQSEGSLKVENFSEAVRLAEQFGARVLQEKVAHHQFKQFFPMYLVKVSDFLKMDGVPPSHEQLQSRGLLHEWNMFVTFISHQWCGSKHADPNGLQTSVLRRGLRGLINGTVELEQNIVGTIYALAPDWSIPFYVEVCNLFIVLAPEIVHEDTGALCNYSSWLSRIPPQNTLCIRDWKNNRVGEGDFTEEADRMVLTALGSEAMERKLEFLKNDLENLHWFRFYTAFQSWILGQDLKKWDDLSEFLEDFHFNSDATSGDDKMFGLLCAVLAGDTGMVQQLVRLRADVHRKAFGLGEMGYYNSMTPLMIACMSNQSAEMLTTLLDLNANVHDRSFAGVNSAFLARSPQQVQVLLDAGADFSGQRLPAGDRDMGFCLGMKMVV